MSTSPNSTYGVILHFRRLHVGGVHPLFSGELTAAFARLGMATRIIEDYHDLAAVAAALADPDCRFFLCYNGFGSEIRLRDGTSAYSAFGKPLIDFMHDCPANDAMQHQVNSSFSERHLFLTDLSYVAIAREMGFANVHFIPSITFPGTTGEVPDWQDRTIAVLFPASLPEPGQVLGYFRDAGGPGDRMAKSLFDQAVARISDWRVNPLAELRQACRDANFPLDFARADSRFLFTAVTNYTHIVRRRELLAAIAHLPVTVMSTHPVPVRSSALKIQPPGGIAEVMRLMARSKAVLCPPAHPAGFHERVLGALGAGALTIEASNSLTEALFADGEEMLLYENADEAVIALERVFAGEPALAQIAAKGQALAAARYAPVRAAAHFLSAVRKFHHRSAALPPGAPPGPDDLVLPATAMVSGLNALYDPVPDPVATTQSAGREMPTTISFAVMAQDYQRVSESYVETAKSYAAAVHAYEELRQSRAVRLALFLRRYIRCLRGIPARLFKTGKH